jgi:uncharacterized protein (DUF2252 family)
MLDVATEIAQFNAGRDPDRLTMKYANMRTSPFVFLRGTCHLFYKRMQPGGVLEASPRAWICGDMHLENFGTYKGDNRLIYFDINDFDEACLAPCLFEMIRLLSSVLVAGDDLKLSRGEALALCHMAVDAYGAALRFGKARWIEEETAEGMVAELFAALHERSRADHLNRRTVLKGKKRTLRADGKKALPVSDDARRRITAFMDDFASREPNPGFYRIIDVARRIAGTGSLGVDRYVILVEGKGSPDGNYLLDMKLALPSATAPHVHTPQPQWGTQAQRVVEIQQRDQVVSQAFLHAVEYETQPYVLRGLQPSEDRVALTNWNGKLPRLESVVRNMAELVAWSHFRSSGRQGSAIADQLIAFGDDTKWQRPLVDLATQCEAQVVSDWHEYSAAFDRGAFHLPAKP